MAKDVKALTTAELIAEYNQLTGKSIKKFSTRAAGEKQVESARSMSATKAMFKGCSATAEETGTTAAPAATPAAAKKEAAPTPKVEGKKKPAAPKKEAKPKAEKKGSADVNRSRGVGDSWNDPKIAAKRAQRNGVQVAGEQYRSVKAAFVALKLPLNGHIAFRMSLKESGKATFEHNGKKHNFVLTE